MTLTEMKARLETLENAMNRMKNADFMNWREYFELSDEHYFLEQKVRRLEKES